MHNGVRTPPPLKITSRSQDPHQQSPQTNGSLLTIWGQIPHKTKENIENNKHQVYWTNPAAPLIQI